MSLSFFDYALQDKGGKRTDKFLSQMKPLIPYEQIEKLLIPSATKNINYLTFHTKSPI
jgi:hypothetical protein